MYFQPHLEDDFSDEECDSFQSTPEEQIKVSKENLNEENSIISEKSLMEVSRNNLNMINLIANGNLYSLHIFQGKARWLIKTYLKII